MCAGSPWCLPEEESLHYYQVRPHGYHHTTHCIYVRTYQLLSGYCIGPECTKCTVCVHACTYVCASVDSVSGTQWTSVQRTLPAAPLTQSCEHTYIQSTSELRILLHYEHTAGVCYRVVPWCTLGQTPSARVLGCCTVSCVAVSLCTCVCFVMSYSH